MAVYLRNKDLLREVARSKERGEMTPELVKMFQMLVARISRKFYYVNPKDREDTEGQALYLLCYKWHKFDATRSDNPFAYYTQIAKMGFAQGFNVLHPHMERKFGKISMDRRGPGGESMLDMV